MRMLTVEHKAAILQDHKQTTFTDRMRISLAQDHKPSHYAQERPSPGQLR